MPMGERGRSLDEMAAVRWVESLQRWAYTSQIHVLGIAPTGPRTTNLLSSAARAKLQVRRVNSESGQVFGLNTDRVAELVRAPGSALWHVRSGELYEEVLSVFRASETLSAREVTRRVAERRRTNPESGGLRDC